MKKVLNVKIFIIVALAIVLLASACLMQSSYAVESDEEKLVVSVLENEEGTLINVENIQNFLNAKSRYSQSDKLSELLLALQYTQEEIDSMSKEKKESYASSKRAQVSSATYDIETMESIPPTQDESSSETIHKLTITARVIYEGKVMTGVGERSIFRISSDVVFDRSAFYNPQMRYKDLLSFNWGEFGFVYTEKYGYMTYDVHNVWNKKYKRTETYNLGSEQVQEYRSQTSWGIKVDLPANNIVDGFTSFKIGSEVTVAIDRNFSLATAYGHKRLVGGIEAYRNGYGIFFEGTGIDASATPLIGVML